MTISTFDLASMSAKRPVCVHCGHPIESLHDQSILRNWLRILVVIVSALIFIPLAVFSWKVCSKVISDRVTHSVIDLQLEDWSQY